MIFFTADTHFYHNNIVKYCGRPFINSEHMNQILIEKWNSVVGVADTVYHLGDFAMGGAEKMAKIGLRLNGKKKFLKLGNHDKGTNRFIAAGFKTVIRGASRTEMIIGGDIKVQLSHYPYKTQLDEGSRRFSNSPTDDGGILLCGHIHEKWKIKNRMVNVGVDVWDFAPVSEDRLVEFIKENKI